MIIDCHTHIFPDSLAPRAIASLESTAGMKTVFDGTASELVSLLDSEGIDKAFVLNTVTNSRQVANVNAFACATQNGFGDRLVPFGSVHPDTVNVFGVLAELAEKGIRGIKFHPDYVGCDFDSARAEPIVSAACELGLPLVIHSGFDPVSPGHVHASARMIERVCNRFPRLRLVAAHLGGMNCWDEVAEILCGIDNLWLDTAFCCERTGITLSQAQRIFDLHPKNRILFGSDTPWARPSEVLEFIGRLSLSDEDKQGLLWGNAVSLIST